MTETVRTSIERGDSFWERRAEGRVASRPTAAPIDHAISAYEEALALAPADLEARWKLMRALFFRGEHVETEERLKLEIFERGRQLGESGIDQIAAAVGGRDRLLTLPPDTLRQRTTEPTTAAEIFFWSAVHTGLWGRTRGKLASAREGVAGKIRDLATISIALDPSIENGGGHRILGRLHTEAPKIPFITGWIDREVAIRELETCHRISPTDLTTRLYLAEALIDFAPRRRQEGLGMLRALVASDPDPRWMIEELKAIEDAKVILARVSRP